LNARSGELIWRERVARQTSSSLLHASGRIYLIDEQGKTYVFAATKSYKLLAENDLSDRTLASFAADDGTLYVRTASALWRIGEK